MIGKSDLSWESPESETPVLPERVTAHVRVFGGIPGFLDSTGALARKKPLGLGGLGWGWLSLRCWKCGLGVRLARSSQSQELGETSCPLSQEASIIVGSAGQTSLLLLFEPRGDSSVSFWGSYRFTVVSKAPSCRRLKRGYPDTCAHTASPGFSLHPTIYTRSPAPAPGGFSLFSGQPQVRGQSCG